MNEDVNWYEWMGIIFSELKISVWRGLSRYNANLEDSVVPH